jgi:UDP-N-acetylglucosamine transferase subunit ALG13
MARPLVAVLLGTDHHPFDRLIGFAEAALDWTTVDWFVQHGYSPRPARLPSKAMLAVEELDDLLARAAAVVTHGGPGLIMEARAAGHVPVVVPRDPALHEHVDGHQLRFAARIARDGLIHLATTREEFETGLARALIAERKTVGPGPSSTYFSQTIGTLVAGLRGGS